MARPIQAKNFSFNRVQGLSQAQLDQHYQLYLGYVKHINQIRESIPQAKLAGTNTTYSEFRALKVAEPYALNGVKLHELYFGNLGITQGQPDAYLLDLINQNFGSFQQWKERFIACGKSSRGWVILAYDSRDQCLHNFVADSHDIGGIWYVLPLLVLDVYEHAYMIDFGIDRDQYLQVFMDNINWQVVSQRCQAGLN